MPEEIMTLLCTFSHMKNAADTVSDIINKGILPRTLEFMDHESIMAVEAYKPTGLPQNAEAVLLIEVDGTATSVPEEAEKVVSLCKKRGAGVKVADDIYARQRLWEARRAISPALYRISPSKINEDIVVPRSRIPEMLKVLYEIGNKKGLKIVNFGHAGDGNIHVNIMTDKENKEEYKRAEQAVEDIFKATLSLGGTISGEHGVGLTKKRYLHLELSRENIRIMKMIKEIFDPKGIMNPGKIFPDEL
jgi:glycolate oxidase